MYTCLLPHWLDLGETTEPNATEKESSKSLEPKGQKKNNLLFAMNVMNSVIHQLGCARFHDSQYSANTSFKHILAVLYTLFGKLPNKQTNYIK